jgi:single-strand DNA-binding protein
MNKIFLIGNICNDLELKENGDVSILHFNVAVQRKFKNKNNEYESDFFRVTAFEQQAKFINNYFSKGSKIVIEGRLQNNNYTDANGKMQYSNAIIIENVEFCGAKQVSKATTETTSELPTDVNVVDDNTNDYLPF